MTLIKITWIALVLSACVDDTNLGYQNPDAAVDANRAPSIIQTATFGPVSGATQAQFSIESHGGRFITVLSADGPFGYPKITVDGQFSNPHWVTSSQCSDNGFFVYGLMMEPTRIAKNVDITFYVQDPVPNMSLSVIEAFGVEQFYGGGPEMTGTDVPVTTNKPSLLVSGATSCSGVTLPATSEFISLSEQFGISIAYKVTTEPGTFAPGYAAEPTLTGHTLTFD